MIFIDSNIPMYIIGKEHENKQRARVLLERLIGDEKRLVTDAEVFQEILHRYKAIERIDAIQPAYDALLGLVDDIFSVSMADMVRAKELVLSYTGVSARDAVHAAVMKNNEVDEILTFDAGFDSFGFLRRLY